MSNSNSCLTTLFSGGGGGGGGGFFSKKRPKRNTSSRVNSRSGKSSSSEPPSGQRTKTDVTMGKRIALFAAIVPTSCSLVFLASWGGAFLAPPAANAREEEERFSGSASSKRTSAKGGSSTNVENEGEILSGKINLNGRRLVAIGDVHGDFPAAMKALEIAGVMDNKGEWIGKNTVVVQVGDVMDRGDAELAIFTKFLRLKKKAMKEGGDVIVMNGNHEIMNVMGDFRYATNGAYLECGTYLKKMKEKEESSGSGDKGSSSANSNKENASPDSNSTNESSNESEKSPLKKASEQFQNEDPVIQGVRARRELFQPGGAFAMKLSKHPTVLQVGDTIFAHAGVNQSHVKYGFDRINREVSLWMQGKIKNPPDYIVESEGVVWTREYGGKDAGVKYEAEACRRLKSALALTSDPEAKRLVIGHTPQTTGVNSGCKGAVWRVDVGASRGIYGGTVEVLEIKGSRVRVLS